MKYKKTAPDEGRGGMMKSDGRAYPHNGVSALVVFGLIKQYVHIESWTLIRLEQRRNAAFKESFKLIVLLL